jgi:hypothetical protein
MNQHAPSRIGDGIPPPNEVDQIRSSGDAWHRRDLEATLAPYAEDIEWETTEAFPNGRLYSGMPAFRPYVEEVLERWGGRASTGDPEILVVNGTSIAVVRYRMLGRSHSGVRSMLSGFTCSSSETERSRAVRHFTSLESAVVSLGTRGALSRSEVGLSRVPRCGSACTRSGPSRCLR